MPLTNALSWNMWNSFEYLVNISYVYKRTLVHDDLRLLMKNMKRLLLFKSCPFLALVRKLIGSNDLALFKVLVVPPKRSMISFRTSKMGNTPSIGLSR